MSRSPAFICSAAAGGSIDSPVFLNYNLCSHLLIVKE